MNIRADKTQENKSKLASAANSQIHSNGASAFQFLDNRPEAIAQRKILGIINNSSHVSQLRAFQDMANNSHRVKQAAQLQAKADNYSAQKPKPIQKKEYDTGLPDNIKTGVENLSGYSMDDVKVHYNSDKPTQLQAHAYAQGTHIHVASGQEKHLPHEAWHVVQQKQGRVKPTTQMKGKVNINDAGLEKDADEMGAKAIQNYGPESNKAKSHILPPANQVHQLRKIDMPDKTKVVTEHYTEDQLIEMISSGRFMQPGTYAQLVDLNAAIDNDEFLTDDDAIFTDSESESDDPAHEGIRVINKESKKDLAEFDRAKLKKKKLYEDKMADFSKVPVQHQNPQMIENWISKQVLGKVAKKLEVIEKSDETSTVRCFENTGLSADVIMTWVSEVRTFKIVLYGNSPLLREQLASAVEKLRIDFPTWKITAKLGDPKAREDHDNMHERKRND